jgi:hypothetical protein
MQVHQTGRQNRILLPLGQWNPTGIAGHFNYGIALFELGDRVRLLLELLHHVWRRSGTTTASEREKSNFPALGIDQPRPLTTRRDRCERLLYRHLFDLIIRYHCR